MFKEIFKNTCKKFPQNFITNISIESNRPILELTVLEIYKTYSVCNLDIEECIEKGLCYKEKEEYIKIICYSKISELYLLYLESKRYNKEIQYIKNHIGVKMYLFLFVSENFINYYLYSKPHFCHNKIIDNKNGENMLNNN